MIEALSLALVAGLSIPLGALISSNLALKTLCLRQEVDSFVSYFGGGALLAAIALVLIPHGIEHNPVLPASAAFLLGGIAFWRLSAWVKAARNAASQFIGMLLDFTPEAILLGAAAAAGSEVAYLLAGFIALQNTPEGFAAYHEMREGGKSPRQLWPLFLAVPLVGPLAAGLGFAWPAANAGGLGLIMLFCSGGILYLVFEDIAPGAHLKHHDFPALGAVSGFLFGMIGTMLIH